MDLIAFVQLIQHDVGYLELFEGRAACHESSTTPRRNLIWDMSGGYKAMLGGYRGDPRPMEKKMEATVWGSGLLVWPQKPS